MRDFSRRSFLLTGSAAVLSLGLPSGRVFADWKSDWEKIIEGAKKEGAVVVSASSNRSRRDFITKAWSKDFPDIRLSYQVVSGSSFVPSVVTERSAGKYLWDIFHSGPPSALAALGAGLLDPLLPELTLPEVNNPDVWGGWNEAFYDPEKKYILGLFKDITAPYYNARMLDPEKVKRLGANVLFEPELKGKIYWYDPRTRGPGQPYLALLDHVLGTENLRRFIIEQAPVFVGSQADCATAIARGRAIVAFANRPEEAMSSFIKAGMDLDIRILGNGPEFAYIGTGGGTLALYKNCPHPNAARLFANWIMTREIGVGLSKAQGLDSARSDVPPLNPLYAAMPGVKYVNGQLEEEVVNRWATELKTLRPM